MIPILFESNETAFTSNGLHRLIDTIFCVVVEERNGIYECDFEYPVNGQYFEEIRCGRIIGVKHDDSSDVQPFDIVSFSKPIDGIVSFHAVHISYRLKGYVVQDNNINSLSDALTSLASATPSNSFTYTADFSANGYAAAFNDVPRSVRQLLGGVEGSILDTYGGEYEWDKFSVILHNHRGTTVDFVIRYGFNMVSYDDETDYSDTYTSAIPYWIGTDADGVEKIVVGNKVNSGLTPYNNMEKCIALDLSEAFETEPTTAELETLALSKMTGNHVNNPHQSIDVQFVRLQDFSEYSQYSELLQCKLCDTVKVIFPDYQTSANFKIVRTEYDVLRERFTSMQLGTLSTTLAEALGVNNSGSYVGSISGGGGVTGVKGNAEATYRSGNVNLTPADIGALPSTTPIHNVPSGGSSGQVLAKASGTDYDLTWVNQSGGGGSITDVQVNGTTVVTNNVADVPVARSDRYGVIKGYYDTDPGGGVIGITIHNSSEQELTGYAPMSVYVAGSGYQPIMAKFLPDATQSTKGAISASDKTKLDGIASGAEVNVQSNWTEADSSSDAYILNKPTIPSTAADVGAVPTSRTVNGKALSSDITLDASDVSALPDSTAIHNVPNGGSSGQVLSKASATDYDLAWITPSSGVTEYDFTTTITPSIDARGVTAANYYVTPTDPASLTVANARKIEAYLAANFTASVYPGAYKLLVTSVYTDTYYNRFVISVKSNYASPQATSSTYVSGTLHIVAPFEISNVSAGK